MISVVEDASSATLAGFDQVIDVRSPSEFAADHVPGAVNMPVLDDAERALIGGMYVQDDPFRARRAGAALVSCNIARHLEGALAGRGGRWRPLVYCWRGGQRSNAFATVLDHVGWRTAVLKGGYQTYRRGIVADLYGPGATPHVVLLGGVTGVGKTELLARLAEGGSQIVDLEALASHRGSLFGAIPNAPQPPQRLFETRLHAALSTLDPDRPVIVEAESSKLGDLLLPPRLWRAMLCAPVIQVTAPPDARVRRLVAEYGGTDSTAVIGRMLQRLPGHLGRDRVAGWCALLTAGDLGALARELLEIHYDPAYRRSQSKTSRSILGDVSTGEGSQSELLAAAKQVCDLLHHAPAGG